MSKLESLLSRAGDRSGRRAHAYTSLNRPRIDTCAGFPGSIRHTPSGMLSTKPSPRTRLAFA